MESLTAAAFLRGETSGPGSAVLRALLIPPSWVYQGVLRMRAALYALGVLRRRRLPLPVLSVGNLTVGGTGKTPFVRLLGRILLDAGHRPLILSRGYGAPAAGGLDEEGASLARDLPEAVVAQGPDRFRVAVPYLENSPAPTVAILDDGGQTLGLHRDLDIFLVDAARPFGGGRCLPAGSLREPARGISRADLVVVTRSMRCEAGTRGRTESALRARGYLGPVIWSDHVPDRLLPGDRDPASLRGRRVVLLSGLADPSSFRETVERLGAEVVLEHVFPDHHRFTEQDLSTAAAAAVSAGASLLASGKDEPKLRGLSETAIPLEFLEVVVQPDPEGCSLLEAALSRLLRSREHEGPGVTSPASNP